MSSPTLQSRDSFGWTCCTDWLTLYAPAPMGVLTLPSGTLSGEGWTPRAISQLWERDVSGNRESPLWSEGGTVPGHCPVAGGREERGLKGADKAELVGAEVNEGGAKLCFLGSLPCPKPIRPSAVATRLTQDRGLWVEETYRSLSGQWSGRECSWAGRGHQGGPGSWGHPGGLGPWREGCSQEWD